MNGTGHAFGPITGWGVGLSGAGRVVGAAGRS
jgi:hypothetical protein